MRARVGLLPLPQDSYQAPPAPPTGPAELTPKKLTRFLPVKMGKNLPTQCGFTEPIAREVVPDLLGV